MIQIGIDPGTHTGVAVWDTDKREFLLLKTLLIHQAMELVLTYSQSNKVKVVFEDARQRGCDKRMSAAKAQGAGSVKRDSSIWEDFLTDHKIEFWAKPPTKGATKLDEDYFRKLAHWDKRTSNHARDAALLVIGA